MECKEQSIHLLLVTYKRIETIYFFRVPNLRELGDFMPKRCGLDVLVFQFCIIFLLGYHGSSYGDVIRKPVMAGKFYPESAMELKRNISYFTNEAAKTKVKIPSGKFLRALIMPHAGFIYSGLTAAHASLVLGEKRFSKVIMIGPDHRVGFLNGAISDVDGYQTPLGIVPLHADAKKLRLGSDFFKPVPLSDKKEHCLEVVLPFLQHYLGEFELVPIVLGRVVEINGLSDVLLKMVDQKTLIVVSSDLSHYLPYARARTVDMKTLEIILELDGEKLAKRENAACGIVPVLVLVNMAKKNGWKPVLIHYSNSGDTAGDKNKVVGYSAIAFYGDGGYEKEE